MNKITIMVAVALGVSVFAWTAWYTVVKFSNPALTETQVLLQTWQGIIPIAVLALLLALADWIINRNR